MHVKVLMRDKRADLVKVRLSSRLFILFMLSTKQLLLNFGYAFDMLLIWFISPHNVSLGGGKCYYWVEDSSVGDLKSARFVIFKRKAYEPYDFNVKTCSKMTRKQKRL